MRKAVALPILLGMLIGVGMMVTVSGCGSGWSDDYHYYDDSSPQKTLYLYLNVADQDGHALPDVVIWLDGDQQDTRTGDSYEQLGAQFPPSWRGWNFNWHSGPIWRDTRDCWSECRVEIMVSRVGYQTQRSHLTFDRWDPQEIYVRQTFVMEHQTGVTAAEVVDAPQPPEKWSPGQ